MPAGFFPDGFRAFEVIVHLFCLLKHLIVGIQGIITGKRKSYIRIRRRAQIISILYLLRLQCYICLGTPSKTSCILFKDDSVIAFFVQICIDHLFAFCRQLIRLCSPFLNYCILCLIYLVEFRIIVYISSSGIRIIFTPCHDEVIESLLCLIELLPVCSVKVIKFLTDFRIVLIRLQYPVKFSPVPCFQRVRYVGIECHLLFTIEPYIL